MTVPTSCRILAVSVMTTVSRSNKDEIPALIDLLGKEEVTTFALERLIPEGRGAGQPVPLRARRLLPGRHREDGQ